MSVALTVHAEQRRVEFGYTLEQVEETVKQPELSYPAGRHWPNRHIRVRGPIKSVLTATGLVITLMPADRITNYQPWSHQPPIDTPSHMTPLH